MAAIVGIALVVVAGIGAARSGERPRRAGANSHAVG
jgi:hypothetical protein